MSIARQIVFSVIGLFALLNTAVNAVNIYNLYNRDNQKFNHRIEQLGEISSLSMASLVWSFDFENIILFSKKLTQDKSVKGVLFVSPLGNNETQITGYIEGKGKIIATSQPLEQLSPSFYSITHKEEVFWHDEKIADAYLFLDRNNFDNEIIERVYIEVIETLVFMALFAIIIYLVLKRTYLAPFAEAHLIAKGLSDKFSDMAKVVNQSKNRIDIVAMVPPSQPNYTHLIKRKDEVGDFLRAFDSLISTVSFLVTQLSEYSEQLNTLNEELEERVKERTLALSESNEKLTEFYQELQTTQVMMTQQEKLASIGQLAAGVAHEINNPIGFVSSNINSLGEYIEDLFQYIGLLKTTNLAGLTDDLSEDRIRCHMQESTQQFAQKIDYDYIEKDIPQLLRDCREGIDRVKDIVDSLRAFARKNDEDRAEVDINEAIESTLRLVMNELKYNCTILKNLNKISLIDANFGQVSQVISNLLVNACHAIKDTKNHGTIEISTWENSDHVHLSVKDTGKGMSSETKSKIFDPFFTTKPVGEGTGLGLNISYDIIVNQHNGAINVESALGVGTTFTITLPKTNTAKKSEQGEKISQGI